MDDLYQIKRVLYQGNHIAMLMQNCNGPCPLLAIANTLLLRQLIPSPHTDMTAMRYDELAAQLAQYMLDANSVADLPHDETRANTLRNVDDAISLFPKLQSGLDVNVRFTDVDAVEFSQDMLLFDLMGVRLVHGWLVDPDDVETVSVVGKLSYNQLVEMVIEAQADEQATSAEPQHDEEVLPSEPVLITFDDAAPSAQAADAAAPVPPQPAPPAREAAMQPGIDADEEELLAALALSLEAPSPVQPVEGEESPAQIAEAVPPQAQPRSPPPSPPSDDRSVPGLVAREWLERSASQLTYYGLSRLHQRVGEGELCIFFRNNHFGTITKHSGELYLLATDIGYLDEPLVMWERLCEVDGDSDLCGPDFRKLDAAEREASQRAREAAAAAAYDAPGAYPGTEGSEAHALPQATAFTVPSTPTADEEADLALAVALQQEEADMAHREDEERAAEERALRAQREAAASRQRPPVAPSPRPRPRESGGGCVLQ